MSSESDNVASPNGLADASRVTVEQLAAVRALFDTSRRANEYDILLTTALELLRDRPLSGADLLAAAQKVWPGAGVDEARLTTALQIGTRMRFVAQLSDADRAWCLTDGGKQEIEATRDWANDALARTTTEIEAKFAAIGREVSAAGAKLWAGRLVKALSAGIRESLTAYRGEIEMRGTGALAPRAFDRDAMQAVISGSGVRDEDAEVLSALALDAFDPLTPFGNDLVMYITVGYMLHAFIGRRDQLHGRTAVGTLRGDRAILDTPVLMPLLGVEEQGAPVERAIQAAVAAGMEVVVPEHYLEELEELVDRVGRDAGSIQGALSRGQSAEVLAQIVEEEALALFLRGMDRGQYTSWEDFRAAVANLRHRVAGMGVIVRAHFNKPEDDVDAIERDLRVQIEERSLTGRGRVQIRRDAETIAMARRRRKRRPDLHPFWPGAWVITPDQHMRRLYARLEPRDQFPLTLTASQWLGVVSTCSDPKTAEELAESAARLLSEETFLAIAGKFPMSVALEVAKALDPDGKGETLDTRMAQLSVEELLQLPDLDADSEEAAAVAARVVTRRSRRSLDSYRAGNERLERDRATAAEAVRAATAEASRERSAREAVEEELSAERRKGAEEKVLAPRRFIRRLVVGGLVAVGVLAVGFAAWAAEPAVIALAASSAIAAAVFFKNSEQWTHDPARSWPPLLVTVVLEIFGLLFSAVPAILRLVSS